MNRSEVAGFFEPSIASMIKVIDSQRTKAMKPVSVSLLGILIPVSDH